ncbi:MAG: sulfatase [Rikenellaceae bacterium]
MNNYKFFLSTLGCLSSVVGVAADGEAKRPNILFIIADDASRTSFGAYGGDLARTPSIDKLAEEGAIFQNAFTQNPKSCPSRGTLVTGMHSWQLKDVTNHYSHFPEEFAFYPHLLREEEYHVGYTGKGWGPGTHSTEDNPAGPVYNKIKLKAPYKGIKTIDYAANFEAFLDEREAQEPFCFWLGCLEPHRVYEKDSWRSEGMDLQSVEVQPFLPQNDIVRGDLLDYAVEVEWFDRHVGLAVEALRERGELDNTLIIVTSDHGMPFPRVKGQIYDEAFHVPFIAYWRGVIKSGRSIDDFIGFQDVAPTLMEVAGLEPHPQMTGSSFLGLIKSRKSGQIDRSRDYIVLCKERHDIGRASEDGVNLGYPVRAIRTEEYLYAINYKSERWPTGNPEYGYRDCDASPTKSYLISLKPADPDYPLFELAFGKRTEEELYDMKRDPHSMLNLAYDPAYAQIKAELRARMERELTETNDPRMEGRGDIFDSYGHVGRVCNYNNPYGIND